MLPVVTLNDGNKIPFFGFGTYNLHGQEAEEAIKYAIEIGYRHFDTAYMYENEKELGNAVHEKIEDGTVKREDLFITTKLSIKMHKEDEVVSSCKTSLKKLRLDYVDLFLIHCPVSLKNDTDSPDKMVPSDIDYLETWRGMEKCKALGLAHSIGISNFNSEQITRLLSAASIKPVTNQVEVSINLSQKSLIEFCKKHNIIVTGYSPLGNPSKSSEHKSFLLDSKVKSLAEKYQKSPAQIALRFVYQIDAIPIPKSAVKSRIKENIEIFDFNLTAEEISELQSVGTGNRVCPMTAYKNSKYFPLNVEF